MHDLMRLIEGAFTRAQNSSPITNASWQQGLCDSCSNYEISQQQSVHKPHSANPSHLPHSESRISLNNHICKEDVTWSLQVTLMNKRDRFRLLNWHNSNDLLPVRCSAYGVLIYCRTDQRFRWNILSGFSFKTSVRLQIRRVQNS